MQGLNGTMRTGADGASAVLSVSVSAGTLGKSWAQCGRLVDYMAAYVSVHGGDTKRGAMMFSAVFNGVLEAVARNHAGRGAIDVALRRTARSVELCMEIPVEEDHRRFYAEAAALLGQPGLKEWYREQIGQGALDCDAALLGLAELVTIFRSELRILPSQAGSTVGLIAIFPLSEMEES